LDQSEEAAGTLGKKVSLASIFSKLLGLGGQGTGPTNPVEGETIKLLLQQRSQIQW
jgi:hypothetical protein